MGQDCETIGQAGESSLVAFAGQNLRIAGKSNDGSNGDAKLFIINYLMAESAVL
jgi:hypothetical protein